MNTSRDAEAMPIVICCAPDDVPAVRGLAQRLRIEGWVVQLAPEDLREARTMREALRNAGVVLICLSRRARDLVGNLHPSLTNVIDLLTMTPQPSRLLVSLKLTVGDVPSALAKAPQVELFGFRGYAALLEVLREHQLRRPSPPRPVAPPPTTTPPAPQPNLGPQFYATLPEFARRRVKRMGRGMPGPLWMLDERRAVLSAGGGVGLFDLRNGSLLWEIDMPLRSAALSPDRKLLAIGCGPQVLIWDTEKGNLRGSFPCGQHAISSLGFHPTSTLLLAGDSDGTLRLWRTEGTGTFSATPLAQINTHHDLISSVAFAPDGATFASASADRTLKIWRMLDRGNLRTISESAPIEVLLFSPDGETILAATRAREVGVWETRSGRRRATLSGHSAAVEALALNPKGDTVASGCGDGSIRLWRLGDASALMTLEGQRGAVAGLSFSPDGRSLAASSADGRVQIWRNGDWLNPTSHSLFTPMVTALGMSEDGAAAALGGSDGSVRIWMLESARGPLHPLTRQNGAAVAVSLIPDGTVTTVTSDGRARRIDLAHNTVVAEVHAGGGLRSALLRPDEIALVGNEVGVQLWRELMIGGETTWQRWASVIARPLRPRVAAICPKGTLLATSFEERGVQLWRLPRSRQSLPESYRFFNEIGRVRDLSFSPDSLSLACIDEDGSVRIFRIADGSELGQFRLEHGRGQCVAFAPDGRSLALGLSDGRVAIWKLGGAKRMRETPTLLEGHAAAVIGIAFAPTADVLVSASSDGTARGWQL